MVIVPANGTEDRGFESRGGEVFRALNIAMLFFVARHCYCVYLNEKNVKNVKKNEKIEKRYITKNKK
jgi:hypothetical protein